MDKKYSLKTKLRPIPNKLRINQAERSVIMFKSKKQKFINIYVVDDSFLVRKSIYEYLYKKPRETNFGVDFDFIGESALKREFQDQLPYHRADLFFIDMDLPDGTAWGLIEEIYRFYPQAQIIAMTDENTIETQQLRLEYEKDVVAVLEKPFQPNHLYEVFEQAIKERFNIKTEPLEDSKPKTPRPRIYFEDEQATPKEVNLLNHAETNEKNWIFEQEIEDTMNLLIDSNDEDETAPIRESQDPTHLKDDDSLSLTPKVAVQIDPFQKQDKKAVQIPTFIMDEIYEDDDFDLPSAKKQLSSKEELLIKTEEKILKNEENEGFNSFYSKKSHQNDDFEEKNLLLEEKNILNSNKEEENIILEDNEDLFSFNLCLEDENLQKEEIETIPDKSIFEFNPIDVKPLTNNNDSDTDLFEFTLEPCPIDEPSNVTFELTFETEDMSQKDENDSFNLDFHLGSITQNEYFQQPSSYTETSQPQTEEFFFFDETVSQTQSMLTYAPTEEVTKLNSSNSSLPDQPVKVIGKEFVISPPRSNMPGVPTTPKEFGRFGIRK